MLAFCKQRRKGRQDDMARHLALIAAASSSYSAYKIYQMTVGKPGPTKGKR
jgi:hypothetical protein